MIAVTRDEARFMLIHAGVECERFERWRNYEIEHDLDELIDDEGVYVIAEWCPFNGIYCAWLQHAPTESIERTMREVEEVRGVWEADRATGSSRYPNPDRFLDTLRTALEAAKRRAAG